MTSSYRGVIQIPRNYNSRAEHPFCLTGHIVNVGAPLHAPANVGNLNVNQWCFLFPLLADQTNSFLYLWLTVQYYVMWFTGGLAIGVPGGEIDVAIPFNQWCFLFPLLADQTNSFLYLWPDFTRPGAGMGNFPGPPWSTRPSACSRKGCQ